MQYFGENGIIKKAQQAKELYENSRISEEEEMNQLLAEYENAMATNRIPEATETGGNSTGGTETPTEPVEPEIPTGPNGKQLVTSVTEIQTGTVKAEDSKGNAITVPGGFKVRTDLGNTVQDGIVIEDSDGNQFVWIPVSNTNGDGSNKIILDDGSSVEITLGRYTFDSSTEEETIQQNGANYASTVTIKDYYQELRTFRESNKVNSTSGTNATAKDLARFVSSVAANHGYYLARYEASYASGSTFGVGNDSTYYKPASKVSTATRTSSSTTLTEGTLWNYISQGNASIASRQMYYGNEFVESDLVNSYAWDTAIVYIQAMENSNYANTNIPNSSLKNTGETGDIKCNIYDMAGNCAEWSTEYSTNTTSDYAFPCTIRGGGRSGSNYYASGRNGSLAPSIDSDQTFRVTLYVAL